MTGLREKNSKQLLIMLEFFLHCWQGLLLDYRAGGFFSPSHVPQNFPVIFFLPHQIALKLMYHQLAQIAKDHLKLLILLSPLLKYWDDGQRSFFSVYMTPRIQSRTLCLLD